MPPMVSSLILFLACHPSTNDPRSTPSTLADRDGDGIADVHEGEGDADSDGVANADDLDADGDGLDDALEAGDALLETYPFDSDADGDPDFLDDDSDDNCI